MTSKKINKHSPLPFKLMSAEGDLYIYHMNGRNTTYIAKCPADNEEKVKTMEFIITACNSFYQMKEALLKSRKKMREAVELIKHVPAYTGSDASSEDFAVMHLIEALNDINRIFHNDGSPVEALAAASITK